FIKPLGQAICYLHKMGLFHGSIRADNIFLADGNNVTLGDCLSAPCAYRQPVQYETLQRGLAPDIARGPGTPGDDLYAFGVAILAAMTGDIPLRGLSDEAIVQMKTERGSYAALAGERRFTQGISELLHGLLNDDPHSRWNNDDFDHWLLGRRLTPRPAAISKKANRPFRFAGQDYLQVRQLLNAMTNDTKLAAAHISNQDLTRWMSHFSDEKIIKNLENAINSTRQQRFGSDEERLVSNVQMALDPLAPIRYRGISVFPGALPALLAHMILTEAPLTVFAEMLVNKLPSLWLDNQSDKPSDVIVAVQLCEKATSMLQNKMLGFGIERFLYDSNPSLPCFNPQLRERYVLNPKQLLESIS
ncbi:MAG: hypothetical protein EBT69_03110, partial [Verrucomicrobia bacterium]|nr:hypothetical protein [Verrucomicrobiota bacterium]